MVAKVISPDLKAAIEGLHKCEATFAYDIAVIEQYDSQVVWEGVVSVFELSGHPTASACYAWSEPIEGTDKRRVFAVLQVPPVGSPEAAVRASIFAAHSQAKQNQGEI